eukprot:CAMPEP_0181140888 /NCGR_PEP_ID=MMETSP1071-20121207/35536_1 /TAXON_ID=35127 /ORGANISM="Thalassiosira sp., Strain NH16" /LENGTH=142 /DNA_ID=CAMNT_0023227853 /DNA_START=26 /DNA_END=451 /DNA_ORIENTATION=+
MTREQRDKMTQLLIAVIVEFAEPPSRDTYGILHMRLQQRQQQQQQRQKRREKNTNRTREEEEEKEKTTVKDDDSQRGGGNVADNDTTDARSSAHLDFDDRAVVWATSCLNQLLHSPPPAPVVSSAASSGTIINGKRNNVLEP